MRMNKITRQFAAWIACFAIVLAALAPSISQTLHAAERSNVSWLEICSAAGAKLIKVADNQSSHPGSPAKKNIHSEHCAFCSTHAGSFALPPTASFVLPVLDGADVFPALFYQSHRPLFVWTVAQSRAPPFTS